MTPRPETVVDYDAWKRGYMPPSEHVLIDQLAYRGARVVTMSDWGDEGAVWVVLRGKEVTPALRKAMRNMLEVYFQDEPLAPDPTADSSKADKTCP